MNQSKEEVWDEVISPDHGKLHLGIGAVAKYKDLIFMFVKRDFVSIYKQTILGPLWHIIQPLFTTLMFTLVFGKIAAISTNGQPQFIFYLSGIVLWSYFASTITSISGTFIDNANIFGKVYFPRLTVPIAVSISSMISLTIQLSILTGFYIYFFTQGAVQCNTTLFLFPVYVILTALWSIGLGIIVSSLTTKYRDLRHAIGFGIQLYMYATPVIYPVSVIPEQYKSIVLLNPMASIIEAFRYGLFSTGYFDLQQLIISTGIIILVFLLGVVLFNRVEKTFMDTV